MIIREMAEQDIEAVSAVCIASFTQSIAGTLSEEGIATFSQIAASEAFLKRMKEDNLMLVAECEGSIEGVIELKEGRHVAMLFVKPKKQLKGIGRMLLASALRHARFGTVTVRASLSSVPAYKKYGFELKGDMAELAGVMFQPMEIELNRFI